MGHFSHALRASAAGDDAQAYNMWILVFPILWAALSDHRDNKAQVPILHDRCYCLLSDFVLLFGKKKRKTGRCIAFFKVDKSRWPPNTVWMRGSACATSFKSGAAKIWDAAIFCAPEV